MTLTQQVYAQALVMAQGLGEENQAVLETLARAAVVSLTARLRPGLSPEDCKADFVAAAGLYALAALSDLGNENLFDLTSGEDITTGSKDSGAASQCLRYQAELIMSPYLQDRFDFREV